MPKPKGADLKEESNREINEEQKRERLLALAQKIEDYPVTLIRAGKKDEYNAFTDRIRNLKKEMIDKYGEDRFFRTELYHASNHSTPPKGMELVLDLPEGEWGKFLEETAEEFGLE